MRLESEKKEKRSDKPSWLEVGKRRSQQGD